MPNRLTGQSSAYLRQHAENPVDWQPFDDAAFAEAARRDVPVFLSVGYAACHWCHVMAHESFEDPAIGAYLNEHFVPVKVDREERPDVDAAYMAATQLLTRQGGWPMSAFLTPDGRTFHAGTYFPPRPAHGMPSFRQVLEAVTEAWAARRPELEQAADAVARAVAGQAEDLRAALGTPPVAPAAQEEDGLVAAALDVLAQEEDPRHGGFGGAPKFPPSTVLPLLERLAAGTGSEAARRARRLLVRTLDAMRGSALFDQLGGGFYRYSVTREWSLPHYEKMLYDNAQLLRAYARAAAVEPGRGYEHAAADTAAFLLRELRLPGGAFASSLDADTPAAGGDVHSGEGAFYVWTRAGLREVLGPDRGTAAADLMGVAAGAAQPLHPGRVLDEEEQALWDALRPELLAARAGRPAPARDDKVVAGWNGMAVAALAEAGVLLEDPALALAAEQAAAHLWEVHWDGARRRLARTSHGGSAERSIEGLLEDYAMVAEGFLALYRAGGAAPWYERARRLAEVAAERFSRPAPGGGPGDGTGQGTAQRLWSDLADVPAPLLAAGSSGRADQLDSVTPAGTSVLAAVLAHLWALDEDERWAQLVPSLLGPLELLARRAPRSAGWGLTVRAALDTSPRHVVLAGGTAEDKLEARRAVGAAAVLDAYVVDADAPGAPGCARGKDAPGGRFTVYVCRDFACRAPVHSVGELTAQLRGAPGDGPGGGTGGGVNG
ncbi:thioredoxin domain-containing protein [Kocuria rosea]|uniref:thioredoxin domain-containing protein n=1 Tax=Kocuria rosea TaxID=1275 RepID=UPI00203FBCFC|nr:thioredoxin domain-containing protein [Kocuria rosea]MCM3688278.1 thioredoxin domain-containing protein [Kocuria rosea]